MESEKFFHDQEAKAARRQLAEAIDTWQSATSSPQLDLMERSDLLLADILVTYGDKQNTAAYLKIMKDYPEPLIRMALSETKQAHLERRITKRSIAISIPSSVRQYFQAGKQGSFSRAVGAEEVAGTVG